jgi:ribonuclease T1
MATNNVKYHAIITLKMHATAGFWRHLWPATARATQWAHSGCRDLALVLVLMFVASSAIEARAPSDSPDTASGTISIAELPPEAREVLLLIETGGPFPYAKDGSVFGNRERRLPRRPPEYYREYTVPTPGARDRGPRRIIAGRNGELYYTDDHYRRFKRIVE